MQRVADLKTADVSVDILRNVIDRAFQIDGVGDDVDGTAALDARRTFRVHDMEGNADADGGAFAEPHEIDMERKIAHRIQLEVPRHPPLLVPLQIHSPNPAHKPSPDAP